MRILVLLTDAYGGRGGIAQHNRHLLEALCSHPEVDRVVALPRVIVDPPGPLPETLDYCASAAAGKGAYLRKAIAKGWNAGKKEYAVVICGHLNLLPLAAPLARRHNARLIQIVHGVEAWDDPGPVRCRLMRRVDTLVAVSDFTRRRVLKWAGLSEERTVVIPNAIDLSAYGPGPKRPDLLRRYGLDGKRVILTVGRLAESERYKGHDEILEVLPELVEDLPDVAYLIVGDGDDQERLKEKARRLGLAGRVVFAGYVPEEEKLDHYRLADVFAMPGRGEGFGIVYLEAMACGVPVIASRADASREAVLDGELGTVVDPGDRQAIVASMKTVLSVASTSRPERLACFGLSAFRECWQSLVDTEVSTIFEDEEQTGYSVSTGSRNSSSRVKDARSNSRPYR